MLKIENLNISTSNGILILEDITLELNPGEIHAVIGPPNSGKSALGNVIAGKPGYITDSGKISFKRRNLSNLSPEERTRLGIFLTFQDPPDILGITNSNLIVEMSNFKTSKIKKDMLPSYKELISKFDLGQEWDGKDFNMGGTISERKKNEVAQLISSNPNLIVLDDLEKGLDNDTLHTVTNEINSFIKDKTKSVLIFSTDTKILDYISPNKVHLMSNGKIVKSGDKRFLKRIKLNGY